MPMTYEKAFEIFGKHHGLWDAHPEYKPTAIWAAYPSLRFSSFSAGDLEQTIAEIDGLHSDNTLMSKIKKLAKKVSGRMGGTTLKVSRKDYDDVYNNFPNHFSVLLSRAGDQIPNAFEGLQHFIDTSKLPLPDQMRDFYNACFVITCFIRLSPPVKPY